MLRCAAHSRGEEALRQQLAESNSVEQRENVARTENAAELRKQQGKLGQELGNLKQQLAQLSGVQFTELDSQMTQAQQEIGAIWEHLGLKNFRFTSDSLGGLISHLTKKCDGNLHDKGAVAITSRGSYDPNFCPWNAADLKGDSEFCSCNRPGQWIGWDFKAVRIKPTHYTILLSPYGPSNSHLKSWAVEGLENEAHWRDSRTEIDRRENNSDLNASSAVKTFAVARSRSFRVIRLRQTDPNHCGNNFLNFCAFEVSARLQGFSKPSKELLFSPSPGNHWKGARMLHGANLSRSRVERWTPRTAVCPPHPRECFPSQQETGRLPICTCQAGRFHADAVQSTWPLADWILPSLAHCGIVRQSPLFFSSADDASFQSPTTTARWRVH
jgi:hypothetical protein